MYTTYILQTIKWLWLLQVRSSYSVGRLTSTGIYNHLNVVNIVLGKDIPNSLQFLKAPSFEFEI